MRRNLKILGTGKSLPEKVLDATELDRRFELPAGTIGAKSGVRSRRIVEQESVIDMGANAARAALDAAGLSPSDVQLIVCGNALPHQLIPCNAALLERELGLGDSGIPAFDVNSTCLSFVVAFDLVASMIHSGQYDNALIVSSEISSKWMNWGHLESASLFGDGAAAVVVGRAREDEGSSVIASRFETYASAADDCTIVGGGCHRNATTYDVARREEYLFSMDGPKVFKVALQRVPTFCGHLLDSAGLSFDDVALMIPHQASGSSMELVRRKLGVPPERWMDILADHGNCVAASIPMALHEAIVRRRIQRGDLTFLCGTSAGFSVGGVLFTY